MKRESSQRNRSVVLRRASVSTEVTRLVDSGGPHEERRPAGVQGWPGGANPAPARTEIQAEEARAAQLAAQAAAARREAEAMGFEAGKKAGLEAVRAQWAEHFARAGRLLDSLKRRREDLLLALEDDIAAIAFEASVKIIGQRELSHERVAEVVRTAVAQVADQDALVVKLSPGDLPYVDGEQIRKELGRMSTLTPMADAAVELGGCIVESKLGTLDARLETQMGRLRELILETRGKAASPGAPAEAAGAGSR